MKQIKVILADSSPVIVSGFRSFFEKHSLIKVIQDVPTLAGLNAALVTNAGCVCILDWHMTSGVTADPSPIIHQITDKSLLIFSSMPENLAARRQALRMGARGFIGKRETARNVRKAVFRVAAGDLWIGNTSAEALLKFDLAAARAETVNSNCRKDLTAREREVIQMACRGLKSRAIATELRISRPTVGHHLTSIYSKLGVQDRIGLIIYAYQNSLHTAEVPSHAGESPMGTHPWSMSNGHTDKSTVESPLTSDKRLGLERHAKTLEFYPKFAGTTRTRGISSVASN
jgi:DNA-binding NarL/FixJ family response regulator